MPRKDLIRTNEFPYHVTARCHNKEWFELPLSMVWKLAEYSLKEAHEMFPIELINFVLMSNHYHMILITPEANLDKFMREFNRRLTLRIHRYAGTMNQVFGGRYKWCVISANNYFMNCYRYVYQNPIRAGIVKRCEDYPYSTLRYLIKPKPFSIPIFDRYGFKDEWGLAWLNEDLSEKECAKLKNGLRRSEFRYVS